MPNHVEKRPAHEIIMRCLENRVRVFRQTTDGPTGYGNLEAIITLCFLLEEMEIPEVVRPGIIASLRSLNLSPAYVELECLQKTALRLEVEDRSRTVIGSPRTRR